MSAIGTNLFQYVAVLRRSPNLAHTFGYAFTSLLSMLKALVYFVKCNLPVARWGKGSGLGVSSWPWGHNSFAFKGGSGWDEGMCLWCLWFVLIERNEPVQYITTWFAWCEHYLQYWHGWGAYLEYTNKQLNSLLTSTTFEVHWYIVHTSYIIHT